ncbi:tRNA preQ1(34) S-adenosylmethionine ribosyltransferase-isomerase QueA [Neomegalonema sp.]|uniref:tRNA preQ1(34) S-adenosylmethionine ribosyltransferase-isomerase QueA n=1 Tax=Neomegalonema sp. TaxID=2039713 RepID=UPI00262B574A|nr:tRNA preQ1(34) S-adenosylmethionine ribosyltransferase-isomerase QueA [Neomegalonema sp.]MDD2867942.1 tRNA preQ1(34) S-adenosylmethionine ribosyltransferase-isomerase QueA [Neomegalonema sp.]
MSLNPDLRPEDFDFDLPEELIALRPARPRRAARLLDLSGAGTPDRPTDRHVSDLPEILKPDDILIFNDTKVIPARLFGRRLRPDGGSAKMEALLLEPLAEPGLWRALARPGKRLKAGDRLVFGPEEGPPLLEARLEAHEGGGAVRLAFDRAGEALDAAIAQAGVMPLPPYIAGRRPADAADDSDYQTLFAARPGAVAAPTAALHFDPPLMEALTARGLRSARVTLHVGAGTFLPVKAGALADHEMHAEWGEIPAETVAAIAEARAAGGRLVAVGTTVLRLLETVASLHNGALAPWSGFTRIFIAPGWRFRSADLLLTNFHLPRSTLFMLVCAFAGESRMRAAYGHAMREGYRFYSYGDSSLLERLPPSEGVLTPTPRL